MVAQRLSGTSPMTTTPQLGGVEYDDAFKVDRLLPGRVAASSTETSVASADLMKVDMNFRERAKQPSPVNYVVSDGKSTAGPKVKI